MQSASEYAQWRGVSEQRVRELLRSGALPGRRLGAREWIVEDAAFGVRPRLGRPMAPPMAWALVAALGGDDPQPHAAGVRRDRVERHLGQLKDSPDAAPALLASWLRQRGDRLVLQANAGDLSDLRADKRVVVSGVSDPRSGISAGDSVEFWLRNFGQLDEIRGDYLLTPAASGNVVLHRGGPSLVGNAVPFGLMLADLADWNGPREDQRIIELLRESR